MEDRECQQRRPKNPNKLYIFIYIYIYIYLCIYISDINYLI